MRTIFYFCLLVAAAGFHGLEAMGPPPRPSGGPPRPSGRPPGPPGPPGHKGTTGEYGWTDDDYDENEGWVSCGCHDAPSCRKCGTQQHLCNGDCSWSYGGCYRKGPRPTNPGPRPTRPPHPPTGETPVSMPSRPPPTWETPVSIPGSRPPPTYETPVHIGSSTPGPGGNGTSTEDLCEESLCSSTDGCPVVKNTLMTTLPQLNKEFMVSFEFRANEYSYGNVIYITGEDGGPQTIPALMFESTGKLTPMFDICHSQNACQGNYGTTTAKNYSLNEWHSVKFSQTLNDGKYMYKVVVDGEDVNGPVQHNFPEIYSYVKVYASKYSAMKGSIRNLLINTDSSNVCEASIIPNWCYPGMCSGNKTCPVDLVCCFYNTTNYCCRGDECPATQEEAISAVSGVDFGDSISITNELDYDISGVVTVGLSGLPSEGTKNYTNILPGKTKKFSPDPRINWVYQVTAYYTENGETKYCHAWNSFKSIELVFNVQWTNKEEGKCKVCETNQECEE